jgi:arylsulfatase A-like enzyme
MKGTAFEGAFRVPAMAWWPGHIDAGSLNVDMFSHMDWWPTVARLAGLEVPPREWTDNAGNPIIFDGIDLSDSLLGRGQERATTSSISTPKSSAGSGSRTTRWYSPPRTPGWGPRSR